MTENTKKHDSCKHGRYIDSHPKKSRGCIHSGELCRLSKNQCLNCEYFEKKNDFVDVWLDFFDAYKSKN
jgi:hypothetical protein